MPTTLSNLPTQRKRRLGELLIEAGAIDETHLKTALAEQRKWGGKLGRVLVDMGFIDEVSMGQVLAQQLHLEVIDLDTANLSPRVVDHLRLDLAERYGVFPVKYDAALKAVHLATPDPTNTETLKEIEFALNQRVVPVVATASSIDRAVRHYYYGENVVASPVATVVGIQEATFDLEQQFEGGPPPKPSGPRRSAPRPVPPQPPNAVETELRQEIALLREQVEALEQSSTSQLRAVRSLLEILMEAGLVSRDEYLSRLHKPD